MFRESSVRKSLSLFIADEKGAVAILTAIAMMPILMAMGAGIEYMRLMTLRTALQTAVDSAALAAMAATVQLGDQGWIKNSAGQWVRKADSSIPLVAEEYIKQNFSSAMGINATTTTTPDWSKGTMTVTAQATAPTFLLGLANIDKFDFSATATATVGNPGKVREIAIAFDVTNSMNFEGRKQAAVPAAKDFIHKVMNYADGSPNPNTRVALVPFNYYVNVGDKAFWLNTEIGLSWLTSTDDITKTVDGVCWEEKTWTTPVTEVVNKTPYQSTCITDGVSYPCTKYNTVTKITGYKTNYRAAGCNDDKTQVYKWTGCVGSRNKTSDEIDLADANSPVSALVGVTNCPNQRISYLASNAVARDGDNFTWTTTAEKNLLLKLDKFAFNNETYIAPGLLWAWRALSPMTPVAGWRVEDPNAKTVDPMSMLRVWCGDYDPNVYGANPIPIGLTTETPEKPACPYGLSEKIIVLMTDGNSTKSANYDAIGRHEATNQTAADAKLDKICQNVKAKDITIFTIAFMVNDTPTENLLRACANDEKHYYNARSTQDLTKAFESIGQNIMRLRLIK